MFNWLKNFWNGLKVKSPTVVDAPEYIDPSELPGQHVDVDHEDEDPGYVDPDEFEEGEVDVPEDVEWEEPLPEDAEEDFVKEDNAT